MMFGGLFLWMTGCGGESTESNPELEKETVELETVADDLDSTLKHIKELENELGDALDDLDLED